MCFAPQQRALFRHLNFQKCTEPVSFYTFDFEMCFAPQRRAPFRHRNFQKRSKAEVFCKIWLGNVFAWQAQALSKASKTWEFCALPKTMAGVGHLKRICKDAFSVAGAVQETCSSELLGGPGADFLRGVAFWSIRSSVLGRWFCVTGAALRMTWHHFFVAGADRWSGKIVKRIGTRPSALHSTIHFWRMSRRIVSFLLSTSKIEEVSQNCFVFDVVVQTLRKSRRIARFLCCQIQKLRKSRK